MPADRMRLKQIDHKEDRLKDDSKKSRVQLYFNFFERYSESNLIWCMWINSFVSQESRISEIMSLKSDRASIASTKAQAA